MNWTEILTIIGTLTAIFIAIGSCLFLVVKAMFKVIDTKFEKSEQNQAHIKELLSNHVTGTDKKIDKLEAGQNDLKTGQVNLEKKIDQLLEKTE